MNQMDTEYLFGQAKTEEDQPLENSYSQAKEDKLEERKLENAERDKARKEKRYFSAFKLIVGCLVFLGLIYLVETGINLWTNQNDREIANSVIEIIKTLLFTLSGYLFARKENGD